MTKDPITTEWHGQWCVGVSHGNGWVTAWTKRGQIVGPNALEEPGDPVHFDFGRTADEAVAKVLRDVGGLM